MTKTTFGGLLGKLAGAAVLALASNAALASHIPAFGFGAEGFTIDPTAVGEAACVNCSATYINFSYRAEVDQVTTSPGSAAFDETGGGFFNGFLQDLGDGNVIGTGLDNGYRLYFLLSGAGTTSPSGGGSVNGVFNTFTYTMYVDKNMDTTLSPAVTNGGVDESIGVAGGGADDVAVLTGNLVPGFGGFHISGGLAAGDFDVVATATRIGTFFGGAAFEGAGAVTDINGVNTLITGIPVFPFGNAIDIAINGSGNASFEAVPEPGTLTLFGLALAGVAFSRRKKA